MDAPIKLEHDKARDGIRAKIKSMRLTPSQITTICATARQTLGEGARVSLFGSRLDNDRKGGDVDLLVEAKQEPSLLHRALLKNLLEERLQLPVDVVTASFDKPSPFARMARHQSVSLMGDSA
jgi:predicted nucleotidyltransferase